MSFGGSLNESLEFLKCNNYNCYNILYVSIMCNMNGLIVPSLNLPSKICDSKM